MIEMVEKGLRDISVLFNQFLILLENRLLENQANVNSHVANQYTFFLIPDCFLRRGYSEIVQKSQNFRFLLAALALFSFAEREGEASPFTIPRNKREAGPKGKNGRQWSARIPGRTNGQQPSRLFDYHVSFAPFAMSLLSLSHERERERERYIYITDRQDRVHKFLPRFARGDSHESRLSPFVSAGTRVNPLYKDLASGAWGRARRTSPLPAAVGGVTKAVAAIPRIFFCPTNDCREKRNEKSATERISREIV